MNLINVPYPLVDVVVDVVAAAAAGEGRIGAGVA
jgi:hypothetical protein